LLSSIKSEQDDLKWTETPAKLYHVIIFISGRSILVALNIIGSTDRQTEIIEEGKKKHLWTAAQHECEW